MRALLIEDNQVVADSIRTMLMPESFGVDTVAFGEDGVATASTDDYDIILLDLMLPDIDGHDVLSRLREGGVETPILVLSGQAEAENKEKCLDNGANEYLTKPFDRGELLTRINELTQDDTARPVEAGRFKVKFDTNTFLMMYR